MCAGLRCVDRSGSGSWGIEVHLNTATACCGFQWLPPTHCSCSTSLPQIHRREKRQLRMTHPRRRSLAAAEDLVAAAVAILGEQHELALQTELTEREVKAPCARGR
jgi:hypothetical protein